MLNKNGTKRVTVGKCNSIEVKSYKRAIVMLDVM